MSAQHEIELPELDNGRRSELTTFEWSIEVRRQREIQLRAALTELAAANARVKELEAALHLVIQQDSLNRGSSAAHSSITRIASEALGKGAAK